MHCVTAPCNLGASPNGGYLHNNTHPYIFKVVVFGFRVPDATVSLEHSMALSYLVQLGSYKSAMQAPKRQTTALREPEVANFEHCHLSGLNGRITCNLYSVRSVLNKVMHLVFSRPNTICPFHIHQNVSRTSLGAMQSVARALSRKCCTSLSTAPKTIPPTLTPPTDSFYSHQTHANIASWPVCKPIPPHTFLPKNS